MIDIYLVGAGGHSIACIDVIEAEGKYVVKGIFDLPSKVGQKILGVPVIGTDEDIVNYVCSSSYFLVTVGQIKSPDSRIRIYEKLKSLGAQIATVVSPRAYVSSYAQIGEGTIVLHDALINSNAEIGVNCIINSKALIEHGSTIADHTHISTAAVINGDCRVGRGWFVGSNATLKESVVLAERTIVRAGDFYR